MNCAEVVRKVMVMKSVQVMKLKKRGVQVMKKKGIVVRKEKWAPDRPVASMAST